METIKCEKCGQVMGAASEACPKCGTKIIKADYQTQVEEVEVEEQPKQGEVQTIFTGLEAELNNNLDFQRANPNKMVKTCIDILDDNMNIKEGYEDAHEIGAGYAISNCVFSPQDGSEVFAGTLNDNKPHLMMQFQFVDFLDEYANFKKLDCFSLFTEELAGEQLFYSLDCGDNASKAAEIFTKVLVGAYGAKITTFDSFFTDKKGCSKEKGQQEARDNSLLKGKSKSSTLRFVRNVKKGFDNVF